MTEASWQKPAGTVTVANPKRLKFAIAGIVLLGAVVFLLLSGTLSGGRYFITVDEVASRPELTGKTVRITGAVVGDTIRVENGNIYFTVANITDDMAKLQDEGGLAKALHLAVTNSKARRMQVVVPNQVKPDLLKDEAQAIITGTLGSDGVFMAANAPDALLLKCPSKYESDVPQQVQK